ncbi:uncharacterized protein [Chelonus insularis]|uniref:uncharacterized protein n=1 Tax=Chelonus insularis TaxID=460826 RepID=UPI00158A0CB8|nr:uncharacterized protein LOC118065680 [Chelonus insularis]
MDAKKEIANEKKALKATEKQGLNKLNSKVLQVRGINEAIEKPVTNIQDKKSVEIMEEHPETSKSATQSNCEKCKKCVCRDLNIQISPDFVRLLKTYTDLLTLMMSKKYPEGGAIAKYSGRIISWY